MLQSSESARSQPDQLAAKRPSLVSSPGSSATTLTAPVRPRPRMAAPSNEDEPTPHRDTAALYQHPHASPVDALLSQRQPSPEPILGRCSLHSYNVEATDNDRAGRAEAEQPPHAQTAMTEPAATEPGNSDADQGNSRNDQSEDGIMRDAIAAVSPQADGELTNDHRQGVDDPSSALPSVATGRRTDRLRNPGTPRSRKRASVGADAGDSDGEYVPARKRHKVAASVRRKRVAQRNLSLPQRPQARASTRQLKQSADKPLMSDEQQARDAIIASYQEWPLPDATLKCVQENNMAIFQLHFTWPTTCPKHNPQDQPATKHLRPRRTARGVRPLAREKMQETFFESSLEQPGHPDDESGIYQVKQLLARWGKNLFFLRWSDDTTGWEPGRNILDKDMLREFELTYKGFDEGIDVLKSRTRAGKVQYLLHWHGRPPREDSWVDEKLISPDYMDRIRSGTSTE